MKRSHRAAAVLGGVIVTLCASASLSSGTGTSTQDTLRVLFTSDVFTAVNRNDALASAKVWIKTVGRSRGLNLHVAVDAYNSIEDLRASARQQLADLFIVSSMHYLDLGEDNASLDPVFVPQKGEFILEEYLLLTSQDRGFSLHDLRGKKILYLKASGTNLSRSWLTALLEETGLGPLERFSPSAMSSEKASSAILPVFFGTADACVVDASSFEVMNELNPQIGQVLEVCRRSPPFLETIVCVHREYSRHRAVLIDGLANLHKEPAGKQILLVFRIDRLVPYTGTIMDSLRRLRARASSTAERTR